MKKSNEPGARDMGNFAFPRRFVSPFLIGLSLVTLLGGFLRFKALTFQSLWWDELSATSAASHGLRGIIESCSRTHSNPPLFHIFLWLWQKVFGLNELSARALPQDGLNIVVVDGPDISSYFCRALWDGQLLVEQ